MKNANSIALFIFTIVVIVVPSVASRVVSKDTILISASILMGFSYLCKTIEDKK